MNALYFKEKEVFFLRNLVFDLRAQFKALHISTTSSIQKFEPFVFMPARSSPSSNQA